MRRTAVVILSCGALALLAACQTPSAKPARSGGSLKGPPLDMPTDITPDDLPPQVSSDVPVGMPIDEMPLPEGEFTFGGGDGSTLEKAVIVNAPNEQVGVAAVYGWIGRHYPNSTAAGQQTVIQKGRYFDAIEVLTAEKEHRKFYFDITQFFGKFQSQ